MNRRSFIGCAASALAAGRLTGASRMPAALPYSREPKAQLAVSSYPFRFAIVAPNNNRRDPSAPGMTVAQFGEFARDRFDLGAIELLDKHFESTDESYLRQLRDTFAKQHVTLVNIAFGNKAQLCSEDPATCDAGITLHKEWIDHAVMLGCPSVRMRMPVGADPKALNMECAVEALRKLSAYAGSRGILLSLENDSPFTESATQLSTVLKAVQSPHLHVLPDMGNGLAAGDAKDNERDMRQLFPLAYNIAHAKNWETIDGQRKELTLQTVVDIARQAGYRGWYSLESDARTEAAADTERLVHAMVECLERASTNSAT